MIRKAFVFLGLTAIIQTGLCINCFRCISDRQNGCMEKPDSYHSEECLIQNTRESLNLFMEYFYNDGELKEKSHLIKNDDNSNYIPNRLYCLKHTIKLPTRIVTYRDCVAENSTEYLCEKLKPYVELTKGNSTFCEICKDNECNSGYSVQTTLGLLLTAFFVSRFI